MRLTNDMTKIASLVAVVLTVGFGETKASEKPNILFLLADDMRWDSMGSAGNEVVKTPHLDQLAKQGVRFAEARVTTSICMVSRATMLTGQYMSRHGIDRFGKDLSPEAWKQTYPALIRDAGYWMGFVGKYGVGKPRQSDFDFLRSYEGKHWYTVDGEKVHVTERNARDSLKFLKDRPKDKPFCLSVSFFAPHAEDGHKDQYLPQDFSEPMYEGTTIPMPELFTDAALKALPPFLQAPENEGRVRFHWRFDTPQKYQEYMTRYYRLITGVDRAVGQVIKELKDQGELDNTLIVFIGDNGYFHGERKLADKWYPYEHSLRVPLIVVDPRLQKPGQTREETALNIDIAPTLIAAAGLAVPDEMQGRDLAPVYLNEKKSPAEAEAWRPVFLHEHPTISNKKRIPTSHAVVRRDVKYVHWPEWEYHQLFDLKKDPLELINLADDPDHATRLAEMKDALEKWKKRVK